MRPSRDAAAEGYLDSASRDLINHPANAFHTGITNH
jgi:hypothetical protein